jgi:hypothetical protein
MAPVTTGEFWQLFERFSLWTIEVLRHPRILTVLLITLSSLALAFAREWPFEAGVWPRHYWLIFTQLIFFPAMIAVGVVFPAFGTWPQPKPNVVGRILLDGLFDLSLAFAVFWVYRMKRLRWLAASLIAVQQLVVFCASFVAGMRVRGDWL